jgi:4-amino-4-deoxy-L-arabinose transferase-like glycosyltransferase
MLPRRPSRVANPRVLVGLTTPGMAIFWCALLLCCFAVTGWSAWQEKSATYDEPMHFVSAWLQTFYGDFRCDPQDPPLWGYYAVVGNSAGDLKTNQQSPLLPRMLREEPAAWAYCINTLYRTQGTRADALIGAARDRMIGLGVLLGILIAWWAWRLAGPWAAVVALGAFSFDPNFLAHAPLIKNDVPLALALTAFMAMLWLLGERATLARTTATALLLGAAIMIKYSGLLGIPILAIALLCRALGPAPWRVLRWTAQTRPARLAAAAAVGAGALLVVYLLIWTCYGFRFGPTTDPTQRFDLQTQVDAACMNQFIQRTGEQEPAGQAWRDWQAQWRPPLGVRLALWANQHQLAPQAWIEGYLITYAKSLVRLTWLCGRSAILGWWYYFPLAMAFKTPLATLGGLCVAVAIWPWRRRGIFARHWWALCCILLAPVLYMAVAMGAHLNLGLRHVLPVYPYLFILLGVSAALAWRRWPRTTVAAAAILLAGIATETCCAFPDFIPFFNVAAGGARGGFKLLSDSNLDWGQDLPLVAEWEQRHPEDAVYLLYFGSVDPAYYRIRYFSTRSYRTPLPPLGPGQHLVLAVSATFLQGQYLQDIRRDEIERLTHQTPIDVLGGSIYLFELQ